MNPCSLPKLCCLQRTGVPCWKCVVCSESTFDAEIVLSAANWCSLPKVCCLQQICDSLPDLSSLQQISIHCWKCVGCSELAFAAESLLSTANLWFAAETELSTVNQRSLPSVCVLKQICDSLPKLSYLQQISICCRKCVGYGEVAFAVKIEVPTVKQFSLLNCAANNKPVFTADFLQ